MNDLDRIEFDAAADFWAAAPAPLRAARGLDSREVGGARCFFCADLAPTLLFRRALPAAAAAQVDIGAVTAYFAARGQPWAFGCAAEPGLDAFAAALAARGFVPAYAWMKFRRDCRAAPPPADDGLALRVVRADEGDLFAGVVAAAYGLPADVRPWLAALAGRARWDCAVAFDGSRPVGAGAAFVDRGLAWLGFGATLPDARRRGAQGRLIALRLASAAAHGAHTAVTETGERVPDRPSDSYRNLLRAGFVEAGLRRHWLASA